jgi:erythromycin esterase
MTENSPSERGTDSETESETATDGKRIGALEEHSYELATTDPLGEFEDADALGSVLGSASIIGLGEATHGTREFFRLKHRFLRYLVTERDCRVLAMEANFPEALALNEYVVHGDGDPREALEGIYFWTWNVESVLAMVEWLRGFNEGRPVEDRVRFYGFDAQYTSGAIERLRDYFEAVNPELCASLEGAFDLADDEGEPLELGAEEMDDPDEESAVERLDACDHIVAEVRADLETNRGEYVAANGQDAFELALQHATLIEQVTTHRRTLLRQQSGEIDEDDGRERALQIRDRAMADNVEWLLEFEDADTIALWAHDAHLTRTEQSIRGTELSAPSMGHHLAEGFGDEYLVVGFSFGCGSFRAISSVELDSGETTFELGKRTFDGPHAETIDATLDLLGYPLALVDLRSAQGDERLAEWLSEPLSHFSVGARFESDDIEQYLTEYDYSEAFDAICYVAETTKAQPIE